MANNKLITDHVKFLELMIENCTDKGDDVSWGMQQGILISKNDAKYYLKSLKSLKDFRLKNSKKQK